MPNQKALRKPDQFNRKNNNNKKKTSKKIHTLSSVDCSVEEQAPDIGY